LIHHTRIDHHSHKPKKKQNKKAHAALPGPRRRACRPLHMAARGSGGLLGLTRASSPPASQPPGRVARRARRQRPLRARASRGSPARVRPHQRGRATWPRAAATAAGRPAPAPTGAWRGSPPLPAPEREEGPDGGGRGGGGKLEGERCQGEEESKR